MSRPRIYHPAIIEVGEVCSLAEDRRHYLKSVLRMKEGDPLTLFDGCGHEYEGVIGRISPAELEVRILKKSRLPEDKGSRIILCQSVPKAGKMDFIVQKATELGIDRIIPFLSLRSVSRPAVDKAVRRVDRWQKIAVEAARQCGRVDVPAVHEIVTFTEMLDLSGTAEHKIIFWEEETKIGLRQVFLGTEGPKTGSLIFTVVGPEGGFTADEIKEAKEKGFRSVSLGRRVLKVETAVLAILSIIQYETGGIGSARETPAGREDQS